MSTSARWLVIVAVVIAIAVLAGIAVTLGTGGERTYPDGSAERTVQDYLHAVSDRDVTAATSLLSTELVARCSAMAREPIANRGSSGLRATLDRAVTRGETAEVHVRITETFGAGPFGSNDSSQTVVFVLGRAGGQWHITEPPWPLYCPPAPAPAK